MPSRWAPSRRVVSKTWKSVRGAHGMGFSRCGGDSARQRKRPPGYGRSARSRGADCALADDDRAGGVHRVHESTRRATVAARGGGNAATTAHRGWYPVPVIPVDWTPVHRADGELVGYLVPDGAPGLVLPVTLVGAALGPPQRAVAPRARCSRSRGLVGARPALVVPAAGRAADRRAAGRRRRRRAGSGDPSSWWRSPRTSCRVRPEWAAPRRAHRVRRACPSRSAGCCRALSR